MRIEPLNSIARANWAGLVLIHLLDGAVGLCLIRFANAILGELYNRHITQLSGYEAYCPRVV